MEGHKTVDMTFCRQ